MVNILLKIGKYIWKYFGKSWGFITLIVSVLFSIIKWLKAIVVGSFVLVWGYVAAYFLVTTIRRFIMFPFLVTAFIYLLSYAFNDYSYTFLDEQSVSQYITTVISEHDYLINASVFFYQIGLLQAMTIFFNFVIVTFIIKMFINTFKKD